MQPQPWCLPHYPRTMGAHAEQTCLHVDPTLQAKGGVASNPMFAEMREALQIFEATTHYSAPSKSRAFFSALRTLLSEVASAQNNPQELDIQLSAAYKWFSKHRCGWLVLEPWGCMCVAVAGPPLPKVVPLPPLLDQLWLKW